MTEFPFSGRARPSNARPPRSFHEVKAPAVAPKPRQSLFSGLFASSARTLGEEWFKSATDDELRKFAAEIAKVDREKALVAAVHLVFAATGNAAAAPNPNKDVLGWLYRADAEQMRALAERLVVGMQPNASLLAHELERALAAHFDRREKQDAARTG